MVETILRMVIFPEVYLITFLKEKMLEMVGACFLEVCFFIQQQSNQDLRQR
jgi:hypothetical protein